MAKSACSNATPSMLKWAREAAGLSIEDVAEAERMHSATLQEWEQGVRLPTYAQLEKLAARYKRPMMVFFLESPPDGFSLVKDYRTTGEMRISPEARLAIRRVQEKQSWASSYLSDEGADRVRLVRKSKLSDSPARAGAVLRKLLGVEISDQLHCSSASESYRMWRAKCESQGLLVFSFSGVAIDDMRGFAISDRVAPVVAVNTKDDYPARTFSLLHECVHILLGDSGVSTRSRKAMDEHEIERFCEAAAAEALMPMDDFKRRIPNKIDLDQLLYEISRRYWCSKTAALYRLTDSGDLTISEAYEHARYFATKEEEREPAPIPQATLAVGRNGPYFSKMAVGAYYSGDIHGGELTSLLGMKLKHLPMLESHVNPSQMHASTGQ